MTLVMGSHVIAGNALQVGMSFTESSLICMIDMCLAAGRGAEATAEAAEGGANPEILAMVEMLLWTDFDYLHQ
jgi:hypothetical protein